MSKRFLFVKAKLDAIKISCIIDNEKLELTRPPLNGISEAQSRKGFGPLHFQPRRKLNL